MDVVVRMSSADYGSQEFTYGTAGEALEGMKRLARRAREESARDGVEREIVMLCPFDGTEPECGATEEIYEALYDVRRRIEAAGLQEELDQTYGFVSDPLYEPTPEKA